MNAVSKPRLQGQRTWTAAQREHQSRLLRSRQIWLKSTGPRTSQGKLTSSQNASHSSAEFRAHHQLIKTYLRVQKTYLDLLKTLTKTRNVPPPHVQMVTEMQLNFLENELIDLTHDICFGYVPWSSFTDNIVPFSDPPPVS